MVWLALQPYARPLLFDVTMSAPGFDEKTTFSPVGRGRSRLQVKHTILAVYEGGVALAARPITRRGQVPGQFGGLYLQNQLVGLMKWQHKTYSVAVEATNTVGLINAVNSTATLRLVHSGEPTSLNESTGVIVDSRDTRYEIAYSVLNEDAAFSDTFSAFLEVMATAVPHDPFATGAFINVVRVSG